MLIGRQNSKHTSSYAVDIVNDFCHIPILLKSFEIFAETHEIPQRFVPKVNAILHELVYNIILYSFEKNAEERVFILFEILEDGKFTLKIKYKGLAFNPFHCAPFNKNIPLGEREIGGLGFHLSSRLMDESYYERIEEWNIISLSKKEL